MKPRGRYFAYYLWVLKLASCVFGLCAGQSAMSQSVVAPPQFKLQPGESDLEVNVVVTDATPGAVIYYTLTGAAPTAATNDGQRNSGESVLITNNVTFKAIAVDSIG